MTKIQLRRDTLVNFTSKNPILAEGELAYETDTKKLKIGDGTTAYTQLEYFSAGGGGSTNISATLPLKIVDGVISLEVDGQTIQVVDGKLHANLDELGNEVNSLTGEVTDLSGRVTAVEADITKKENKITTTGALSLQEKIQTNAVGFTVTSESAMTNDHYQRVPFPESQSSLLAIQDASFTYPYKSYLAIPYSLGQVIRVPRAYGQLFFGSFDDNGDFIVSIGFNTFYYDTNGFALFGGPVYRDVAGSNEYPPVMPRLNPTQMGYNGNYTYHTPPTEAADSGDLYSLSNYLPENDFSCAFYQISPDTTGAIMIQAFWSINTGRCSTAVYRDTETSYQYAGHLDAMRDNIQYALWLPNETGTSYNPSKFGLYDWNVSRIPWNDKSGWEAFFKGRGANLYSLTGQSSKNYLELNLGDGLSVVDGKLTASSTAPANMVTTDTAQTITGLKTFSAGIKGNGYIGNIGLTNLVYTDVNTNPHVGNESRTLTIHTNPIGNGRILVNTGSSTYEDLHTGNIANFIDGTSITFTNNKLTATGGGDVTAAGDNTFTGANTFDKMVLPSDLDGVKGISLAGDGNASIYNAGNYLVLRKVNTITGGGGNLVLGDATIPTILRGSIVKTETNGKIYLNQGNVTAGDNVTITNTTDGIQISATGSSSSTNIPLVFGMSQYYKGEMNNASWLKSEGQQNTKALYPDFYAWVLEKANAGIDGFKLSTATDITDYDFAINTTDETFRLPLKNGQENLPDYSDNQVSLPMPFPKSYVAPSDGYLVGGLTAGTANTTLSINGRPAGITNKGDDNFQGSVVVNIAVKKGDVITINDYFRHDLYFIPLKGNGNLYYYCGNTVQDETLINVGEITNALAGKLDIPVRYPVEVSDKSLMPSWYVVHNDGWIEQGGKIGVTSNIVRVTLLKTFTNTNYFITGSISSSNETLNIPRAPDSKLADSFEFYAMRPGGEAYWSACGY